MGHIGSICYNTAMIDYQKELNDQQFDAVQNGDGPCLVLAGAGSGKTRTITYRVAWLLEHGVNAQNILLLTFTNKAAKEMIERVENLLGADALGLWAGTYHSIANRLLRRYAVRIGYQNNFSILDQEDAQELVTLCIKDLKIDTKARRFPKARAVHDVISFSANKGCSIEHALEVRFPQFLGVKNEIETIADAYTKLKFSQNSMDFDDLLIKLRNLLRNDDAVREQLANNFKYVLVDEFQDTNTIQAEIIKLLAGKHQNIFVVGDDAQSIYSFRAAEIKNILQFPDQYAQTKTFKLTKNYRSTPQILSVANAVIANNVSQFEKQLEPIIADGEFPQLVSAPNAYGEADFICDKIRHASAGGVPLSDIAVLFRASFHSQALEFELMKRGIDYEYRGGLKFFERAHIKDVIAHLRLINNIKDVTALMRALRIHPGIGLVTAQKIAVECASSEAANQIPNLNFKVGAKVEAGLQGFKRVVVKLINSKQTPADYIRAFTSSDDYQFYLNNEYQNAGERLEDLEQFALFAEQETDLGKFLDYVALTQEYGAEHQDKTFEDDRVILSTVHQAKGLEWHTVFIINLAEGQFPHKRVLDEPDGLEEERRLFYVATTRAKKQLFLTYPVTCGYDSVEYNHPSTFVLEIPQKCYKTISVGPISSIKPTGRMKNDSWEEPTIVFDSLGERTNKTAPSSFLRDISDL